MINWWVSNFSGKYKEETPFIFQLCTQILQQLKKIGLYFLSYLPCNILCEKTENQYLLKNGGLKNIGN